MSVTYSGSLDGSDGSRLTITGAVLTPPTPVPTPDPGPPPSPIPAGAGTVRIGTATYPLAAVDPTPASNPAGYADPTMVGRGPDQLIALTDTRTTNPHGWEVAVGSDGVVVLGGVNVQPPNIQGAYRLSGHGRARDFLTRNAMRGAHVEFVTGTPPPDPGPVPGPVPTPSGRTVAIYRKDGSGTTSRIPDGVNQFRYAFFQGPGLVQWGGESIETQRANLGKWLDADPSRGLLISAGGSKGSVSTSNRPGFVANFRAAEEQLGGRVTGIDWDLEASAMVVDDVVAISKSLAAGREDRYLISFAPPGGSPHGLALQAAVQLHQDGYLVQLGSQLYEAPSYITESVAIGALRKNVDAGLPPSCVVLGTMVGGDQKHWTINMCGQVLRAALDEWEDFGGCYLWSEGNLAQDDGWASAMAAVLT